MNQAMRRGGRAAVVAGPKDQQHDELQPSRSRRGSTKHIMFYLLGAVFVFIFMFDFNQAGLIQQQTEGSLLQLDTEEESSNTDNEPHSKSNLRKNAASINAKPENREAIAEPTAISVTDLAIEDDARLGVPRPKMEATSHTFMDSIRDIERKHKTSDICSAFGGSKFINVLKDSETSLLGKDDKSSIIAFRNTAMDIFVAENVSMLVTEDSDKNREFRLEVDGKFLDASTRSRTDISEGIGKSDLWKMTTNIIERKGGIPECTEYIDYPVMLVDNNIDTWNWWFFLVAILKHYITLGVAQEHVTGDYTKDLRVLYTLPDAQYKRSFVDAFDFMFADGRGRDSRQIWNLPPISRVEQKEGSTGPVTSRYCFNKILWSPGGTQGGNQILINRSHTNTKCFSSIVYSYAAQMKASLHIPHRPRPEKPRVVWVARDTSSAANPTPWQRRRIINNQEEVISYLQKRCEEQGVEFIVSAFHGAELESAFQEQALHVSRADIMIGIHGAGLNMFHFLPFNSVVIEIHMGTSAQMNSHNFVNHVKEGKYVSMNGSKNSSGGLDYENVWQRLRLAIEQWNVLPSTTSQR